MDPDHLLPDPCNKVIVFCLLLVSYMVNEAQVGRNSFSLGKLLIMNVLIHINPRINMKVGKIIEIKILKFLCTIAP